MNIAAKYLLSNCLVMSTGKHWNKVVHLYEIVYISSLNIHVFITFYNGFFLCLIFQARRQFFFHSSHHSFYRSFILYCLWHNTVTFPNQNSLQNLFFFLIPIKKKVWVISSHSRFLFNKYLHLYKYLFWLIPSKDPGNANKVLLHSTLENPSISVGRTMRENMKESRIDNPFTLIGEYSSKRCSSILDYYMKLSHCQVNVSTTNVGADLGPSQKIHRRYLKGS